MKRKRVDPFIRLERLTDRSGDCWVFTGSRCRRSYGKMTVEGKNQYAHRFSYELHKGAIPEGMYVLHMCDNPPCVNPVHLIIGTARDNTLDAIAKGRLYRLPPPPRKTRLTSEQA